MAATKSEPNTDPDSNGIIPGVTRMQDVDGYVGTIVYVGPVASAKDSAEHYAGVVWDDPSRGKHDGSVICRRTNQLVRHFSCAHPCGASFVRLTKLNLGVDMTPSVLRERYVTVDSPVVAPNNLLPHTARTSQGREKPIEFYGELKIRAQQQLEQLNTISLRRMGIARFDDSQVSLAEFNHLTGVDLAGNLLSNWGTVLTIMKQFPNLESFSVAANRIQDPPPEIMERVEEDCMMAPFSNSLHELNLNQCEIASFQTLIWIGKLLPQLQNLCIAHADLSGLEMDASLQASHQLSKLQQLDLGNCKLESWNHQIVPLCSYLPCLEHLALDDNPITTTNLHAERDGDGDGDTNSTSLPPSNYFPQLHTLQLTGTQIHSWRDLDGLSLLSALRHLRFRRCPLLSNVGTGEARALTIARVSQLTKLNSSIITPKERVEAERRYVSSVACRLLQIPETNSGDNGVGLERDNFLEAHKPFASLMETHREAISATMQTSSTSEFGESTVPSGVASNIATTALVVVNVSIQSMAASSCQQEPLVRRLPGSLPIKRIKAICARSFGLDPDLQRLHFCSEFDAFPIELDDDEHTLTYYGVSDGATIFMNEIDPEEEKRQQAKIKYEQQSRLKEAEALEMQKQRHKQQLLQGRPQH